MTRSSFLCVVASPGRVFQHSVGALIMMRCGASRRQGICLRRSQHLAGLQMTEGERGFKEKLAFQIVRLKILQIFEECSKFVESDKKALYEVMGNLLLQRIGAAQTLSPADETPPELTELTDEAPTDDSTRSAKMSGLPKVDVNAAFPK
jgi:hypothetical protein